jgi:hypothetical protein
MAAFDSKINLDHYIVRAASKAFTKTFKNKGPLDVNFVQKDGVHVIKGAEKLLTS